MVVDHSGCSTDPDMMLSSTGSRWCPAPSPDSSVQPVLYNQCCLLSLAQLQAHAKHGHKATHLFALVNAFYRVVNALIDSSALLSSLLSQELTSI